MYIYTYKLYITIPLLKIRLSKRMECVCCKCDEMVYDEKNNTNICLTCCATTDDTIQLNWLQRYEYVDGDINRMMKKCLLKCEFITTEFDDLVKEAQYLRNNQPTYTILQCCLHSICTYQCDKNTRTVCEIFKIPLDSVIRNQTVNTTYIGAIKFEIQTWCDVNHVMSKPCMLRLKNFRYPKTYVAPYKIAKDIIHKTYFEPT